MYDDRAQRPLGIRRRLIRAWQTLRGEYPVPPRDDGMVEPEIKPQESTTTGFSQIEQILFEPFIKGVSSDRKDIYDDVIEMEQTITEVQVGLDTLAANAVRSLRGQESGFKLEFPGDTPRFARDIIEETISRCQLESIMQSVLRETLMMGDGFYECVLDRDMIVSRLMLLDPRSMRRNEGTDGLLRIGHSPNEWAFEQFDPHTDQLVAGFFPWQVLHLRWNQVGYSRYGRPMLYSSRLAWRKLRAMEEALVINWITRAFARLVFYIDVTGLPDFEAQRKIQDFKRRLSTAKLETGKNASETMTVAKDLYVGKTFRAFGSEIKEDLMKVDVLDTGASAFKDLDPLKYYQNKIVMGTRVPKAYFGIEEDINAKATLAKEDIRFTTTLTDIQALGTRAIVEVIKRSLIFNDINPRSVPFTVWWLDPAAQDPVEAAQAYYYFARGDDILMKGGVIDREYVATHHVDMSSAEWELVKARAEADAKRISGLRSVGDKAGQGQEGRTANMRD